MLNPMGVAAPSAKNSTRIMLVPVGGVAVAVMAIGTPDANFAPLVGAVIVTEVPIVTATAGEVVVMALLYVAVAVRLMAPPNVGVQVKLNGDVVLVPISVPLA